MFSMNKYISPHMIEKVDRSKYQAEEEEDSDWSIGIDKWYQASSVLRNTFPAHPAEYTLPHRGLATGILGGGGNKS